MSKRAASGRSSILKGKDGRWHGYVSMGADNDGKAVRRHVAASTQAEVKDKVAELERTRGAGHVATVGRQSTVGEWLDHWLEAIAKQKVRRSTYDGYESFVRNHLKPTIGRHRLDKLQPEHLEAMQAALVEKGLSPASRLLCHRILSRALKVALQRGKVTRNVATLVDAPTVVREEVKPFTVEDAHSILKAAQGTRNGARWSVALALGLRQGEALGAVWPDVDLDAATWRVRKQLQRQAYRHGCPAATKCAEGVKPLRCPDRTGGVVLVEPKSAKGKRTIAIPTQLLDRLKAHRQEQLAERLRAGSEWHDGGYVFADLTGKPIDKRRDWGAWKALLQTAGVRDARLHDARHTAASLLLAGGVSPRVVMEILGHSQVGLTLNTYSHVMPAAIEDATAKAAAVLFTPTAHTDAHKPKRRRSS